MGTKSSHDGDRNPNDQIPMTNRGVGLIKSIWSLGLGHWSFLRRDRRVVVVDKKNDGPSGSAIERRAQRRRRLIGIPPVARLGPATNGPVDVPQSCRRDRRK